MSVRSEWKVVTPEIARKWLDTNRQNRRLNERRVKALARDMTRGNWMVTGNAITFDENGELIDGQHRLNAVMLSGVAVKMLVIRGLERESQKVTDGGLARSVADHLHMYHDVEPAPSKIIAAVCRAALSTEDGRITKGDNTATEQVDYFLDHEASLRHSTEVARQVYRSLLATPTSLAYAHHLISESNDREIVDEFFEQASSLVGLTKGAPALALNVKLSRAKAEKERLSRHDEVSLIVRAWNAYVEGRKVFILRVNGSGGAPLEIPSVVTAA